jgi:hypothetical protein
VEINFVKQNGCFKKSSRTFWRLLRCIHCFHGSSH